MTEDARFEDGVERPLRLRAPGQPGGDASLNDRRP
jgi:hypothetical protein